MSEAVEESVEETPDPIEAEARKEGWSPKEEWRGDPDKWVDAATFVENGKKINGILRSKVEKLESKLEQNLEATKEFREWTQKQQEKERKELKARIAQLEKEREEAISEGDGQRFTKVDREINELRSETVETKENPIQKIAEQWQSENKWYQPRSDDEMSIYADGIADRVAAEGYEGRAYFNEITRRVKARFPDKFENPRREQPASVESPGASRDRPTNGRSFKDLPPEDKAQCERFLKEIPGFTKEQFLEHYDWDQE